MENQALVQQLKALRQLMDREEKLLTQVKPVSAAITALRDALLLSFTAAELESTTAAGLRVTRTLATVPSVTDKLLFLQFATKKANWDLLSTAPVTASWRERLEAGKPVPGVETFNRVGLRVNRLDKKATG